MKRFYLIGIIFTILFAASCSSDIPEDTSVGSIEGSVSDRTTGEPVSTVTVSLSPGGNSTVTGSNGSFSFYKLDPGKYTISISKEGYNSATISANVKGGAPTSVHMTIERIPGVVTADRTLLDFGDNQSLNTLSFNIVNSSYEDLEWEIEERCDWIIEIKPEKGILKYGKTEAIVVVIDRELLEAGINEANIVVRSSNGSSDVKVTAVGAERLLPSLNTLEAGEITSKSATLNGEIINVGVPAYTERGFVYSLNSLPTFENTIAKLTVPINEEAHFSYKLNGLTLGEKYYVRVYATNSIGTAYSTNEIAFTTVASSPVIEIMGVTDINVPKCAATFKGNVKNVGDPSYFERGFVYSTANNPTVENNRIKVTGSGLGEFSTTILGLQLDQRYYVRTYAITKINDQETIVYSKEEVNFELATKSPQISVQAVSNLNVSAATATLNGTVISAGEPAYFERGFVYATSSNPTVNNNKIKANGTGQGAYSANISDLQLNQKYYVRAYAVSKINDQETIVYSKEEVNFELATKSPQISVQAVSNLNVSAATATLNGTVISAGEPAYFERGFVYATSSNPTVNNNKIKANGTGQGAYSANISDLQLNQKYYVRAYAVSKINDQETIVYSKEEVNFELATKSPQISVQAVSNLNVSAATATLNGTVISAGEPAYFERGFVYATSSNPTVNNNKIKANGTGQGAYSANISDLQLNQRYYVRSYAISKIGQNEQVVYSPEQVTLTLVPTEPAVSVQNVSNINVSAGSVTFNGTVTSIGDPVYTERGFVYGLTRNPTVSDKKLVVDGSGTGVFSANVSNLELNKTYYVRTYIVGITGTRYSLSDVNFILTPTAAQVSIQEATNVSKVNGTATLNGTIDNAGEPAYTERGFVYGLNGNPTINDEKISVAGNGLGSFSANISGLQLDREYYVRAFAINPSGTTYSKISRVVSTMAILPEVTGLEINDDFDAGTATFKATISKVGEPAYTERGFVYSTMPQPTIYDNKIVADGSGVLSSFSSYITNLPVKTYYVRAYATNRGGTVYSIQKEVSLPWVEIPEAGIMVQKEDIGRGNWDIVKSMCEKSVLGGYTDWRLPTKEELMVLYNYRQQIGGFEVNRYYWSSDFASFKNNYEYYYALYKGSIVEVRYDGGSMNSVYGRAVRTITK